MRLMRVESPLQSSAISGEQLAGPRGTLLCCRCTVALHDFRNVNSNRCSNIYPRRHPHWWTSVPVKGPRAQLWPQATIGFCADRLICNVCACGISHTLGTECHTSCAARGAWQGVAHMEWWAPACVPLWQSWKGGGVATYVALMWVWPPSKMMRRWGSHSRRRRRCRCVNRTPRRCDVEEEPSR